MLAAVFAELTIRVDDARAAGVCALLRLGHGCLLG
jgi:hypothetical protein